MRLFKSRKSGEYSDVSSVVANENDPNVKIVSCNAQQEFHNDDSSGIQNGTNDNHQQQLPQFDANDNPTNCYFDEQKKHNNIPYSLKSSDNNSCTDKFTPIPDCDQIEETVNIHYDTSSINSSSTTSATVATTVAMATTMSSSSSTATTQETKLHSDSTSDFINELFGTLLSIHISPSIHIVFHLFQYYCFFFSLFHKENVLHILFVKTKICVSWMNEKECV